MPSETSIGISITNACYECQLLDSVCPECEDSRTAKDAEIAHELVDSRNIIYSRQWHNRDLTQQDWISPSIIVGKARKIPIFHYNYIEKIDIKTAVINGKVYEFKSEPYESLDSITITWEDSLDDYIFRNEYAPPITNILDRLGSYWFLGNHIYPLIKEEDLKATIALRKNEAICPNCHLSYNALVGCNN